MIEGRRITPFLWFDGQAEQAAEFYTSIFANSEITHVSRYPEAGKEQHGQEPGSAMVVSFVLDGQNFLALNGGAHDVFNEAISFQIHCADQAEVDHFWDKLSEGGTTVACGWLRDRYGLAWQVTPNRLPELLNDADTGRRERVMVAMMQMVKIDIATLERAAEGEEV